MVYRREQNLIATLHDVLMSRMNMVAICRSVRLMFSSSKLIDHLQHQFQHACLANKGVNVIMFTVTELSIICRSLLREDILRLHQQL